MNAIVRFLLMLLLVTSGFLQPAQAQSAKFNQVQLQQFPMLKPVTLGEFAQGKPVYLKLWASWCQPCLEQMPHF